MANWVSGGCLCGAVRFDADADGVFDAGYCHCSMCRKASGAPVLAWATMKRGSFRLISGELRHYQSSPSCRRAFCAICGAQLFYDGPGMPDMTGIHVATLDEPAPPALQPRLHMCVADKLGWFSLAGDLPKFPDNRLTHPDKR